MNLIEWIGLVSAIVGIASFVWFLYEKKPVKRLSWRTAENAADRISDQLMRDAYAPTLIFGIGRGGAIFGAMISGAMGHCPLIVIDRKYRWSEQGRFEDMIFPVTVPPEYMKRVLLVAGEAHSGRTINHYYEYLLSTGCEMIRRSVLFYEEGCTATVEYPGLKSSNKKVLMPWMRSKRYERADRSPDQQHSDVKKLRLYLVRHAETAAGEDVFSGTTDYDLTVKGIEHASSLGTYFCGMNIHKIYTSPLGRAVKTATIIRNHVNDASIEQRVSLREMDFGEWEGQARTEIQEEHSDAYDAWVNDPVNAIPYGAEKPEDVLTRLLTFLDEVKDTYRAADGVDIIAVTHKTCIRILLAHYYRESLSEYRSRTIGNCEVYALVFDGGDWYIDESIRKP